MKSNERVQMSMSLACDYVVFYEEALLHPLKGRDIAMAIIMY